VYVWGAAAYARFVRLHSKSVALMPRNSVDVRRLVDELVAQVNAAYGLYLDATTGFAANLRMIAEAQKQTGATDDSPFFYSFGAPTDGGHVLLHQTTNSAFKGRNRDNGPNYIQLARFLIVMLFELWETGYRRPVAQAAGVQRDNLLSPVFGDLRLLRHEILHNKSRLSPETKGKLQVISPPTTDSVDMNKEAVEHLVRAVKAGLDDMVKSFTGQDPGYRTVWLAT